MDTKAVLDQIKSLPHKDNGEVYISALKPLVQKFKTNHTLAIDLWKTKNKAARDVAVRIADPQEADENLLETWVQDLHEWGLTDAFTGHLVKYTDLAVTKSYEWAKREPEFERRAGFATIAQMAWAQNDFEDNVFIDFLSLIGHASTDNRFYVKKAVNWALRDIGKRNVVLQKHAQKLALKLQRSDDKTARWIGRHRSKEFMS